MTETFTIDNTGKLQLSHFDHDNEHHISKLPHEVLDHIFDYLQLSYTIEYDPAIFDAMRVSRLFFDLAFYAHMNRYRDYRISLEAEQCQGRQWKFQEKIRLMLWDERWARAWVGRSWNDRGEVCYAGVPGSIKPVKNPRHSQSRYNLRSKTG